MIVAMDDLVWHDDTKKELLAFAQHPTHALLLSGEKGSGKLTAAKALIGKILGIKISEIDSYPYYLHIQPDGRIVKIDAIREIDSFLKLKVPSTTPGITRIVLIESADLMSLSAQNASLKILEEPPLDSLFILIADNPNALLPTIISRVNYIRIRKPPAQKLIEYFTTAGFTKSQIETIIMLSDRLPGLSVELLDESGHHSLNAAADYAKRLLVANDYERLIMINKLSKDHPLAINTLRIIQQMASIVISKGNNSQKWQTIAEAAYNAENDLLINGNAKLILSSFVLGI